MNKQGWKFYLHFFFIIALFIDKSSDSCVELLSNVKKNDWYKISSTKLWIKDLLSHQMYCESHKVILIYYEIF